VPPVAKSLELGTVRKILCKAQGSPSPIVRWVKDGLKPLLWPPHIEDVNGTLVFHGVQDDDAGQYTCIATSSQGLISASILINVTSNALACDSNSFKISPPKFEFMCILFKNMLVSPNFTSLPSNVTFAKEGEKVELNCRATGQPVPTIQWDKDSVMDGFTSDRYILSSD
jgi:PTK7 protein tyrosine kinase 7